MYKFTLVFIFAVFFKICALAQPLNVTNVSTTGRFSQCTNSTPVITASLTSGTGVTVVNGVLTCTDPCGTTTFNIQMSNVKYNQAPDANWLHGLSFPANAGYTVTGVSLPAGFIAFTGCTNPPPNPGPNYNNCSANQSLGPGFYYDGPVTSSCCNGTGAFPNNPSVADGIPCNNWGASFINCNTPLTFNFNLTVCNTKLLGNQVFKLSGSSDGGTGCYSQPDNLVHNIQFTIPATLCSTPLYTTNPGASAWTKDCATPPTFSTTLTAGCGNGSDVTWWTAATGGTQIGTGSPFVYNTTTCVAGQSFYAQCCPTGTTCQTRRAFAVPGTCPTSLTLTATGTNGTCTTPSSIQASSTGGSGTVTYTLNPGAVSNTSGTFSGLTGTSYTVTAVDAVGCSAGPVSVTLTPSSTASFTETHTVVPASCVGVNDGSITINITPVATYTYVIDGNTAGSITNSTGTATFTGLSGGPSVTHTITVTNTATPPCTLTANIPVTANPSPAGPTVTSPVVYCQGATAVPLTATGSNLLWYTAATGGTGSATAPTPSTTTVGNTTYYVTQTTGPCESVRTPLTVTVNTTPAAPTVTSPVTYCQNDAAVPLTATGTNLLWYTTATGGTGSSTAPTPSTTATGSTNYYVSQTTGTCEGPRASIAVNVTPPPSAPAVTSPITYCEGATATALTATGTNLLWYTTATGGTGSSTAPTPSTTTVGSTTYYVSQTSGTCESPRGSITVTINSTPAAPTVTSPVTYCQGATATPLTATGTNLLWYTTATGGTGSATAPTPSTTATGSTIYYVSQTTGTCEGPRAALTVTINSTPAAPSVTTPVDLCQGSTATPLTATGTNLLWYTTATGGTGSATAPTPSTATTGTTIYYVSQTTGTCEGPRASITVNVNATPAAPTVTTPVVYCENATAVPLTATGTNLLWYTTATGGTGSSTAPTPSTTVPGNTTYYVSQSAGTCEGPRAAITVTVNATPAAPTVTTPVTYCQNATATPLTATGTGLLWYTTATGGTGSSTAITPSTTTGGSTTYYVSQTVNGCESPRAAIVVDVTPTPALPTVTSPVTYCPNDPAVPLIASGTGTLNWYTTATGGTPSSTAPTPSTATTGTTNYYVSQTISGCEGPREIITVDVTANPAAPGVTSPVAYCQGVTATPLTATGTNLLWYTTATGGTGSTTAPTPNTATTGSTTYYVSQTPGNCESPRASITVTVNTTLAAPTTAPVSYCQNATATPLTAGGSGLLWYTTPTGGTGSSTAPNPATTTPGSTSYYVSQTSGTCEGPRSQLDVTIIATPAAPTVTSPVDYCQNATASPLTATGTNLLWYTTATGGTGSTTAPTPSTATGGSVNYYVSQSTTTGSCEGPRAMITVNVTAAPAAPTVTSPLTYCQNATAPALTATGTNLLWYTTATGGTGSSTAPTPSTTAAGSTIYYVSQTTGTCEGPRAAITVDINPTPVATVTTTATSCPSVNDATATVNAPTAGTAPFSYTISATPANTTGASSGIFTGLAAGSYTITITDANSCTGSVPVTVTSDPALTATAAATATTCNNATDGTITVSPANAGSYTINTTPTQTNTTGTFTGLAPASYSVTYTAANGCTATTTPVSVNAGPALVITAATTNTSCPAVTDGTVTISPSDPGTYSINTTPAITNTTGVFTGIAAGSYTVTYTAANTCTGTVAVQVQSDPALTATATATPTSCNNATDGTVSVTPANAGSYTINTTPTQTNTTGSFTGLSPASYTVTYTNANGCTATTASVTVSQGAPLSVAATSTATSCPGVNNGTITVAQAGGGGSYTYSINATPANTTGATTGVFTGLSAGAYTVTATENANTCSGTSNVTVAQGAALTSSQSSANPNCFGASTGSFTVTPSSGSAPYSYVIDAVPANTTGASSGTFTGLAAGSYTITFTDANGCTGTQTHTLTANAAIAATETHVNPNCFGSNTGSITISATGGSGVYTYALLPSTSFQSGNTFSNLPSGSYTVRVQDNLGCTIDVPATLTEPAQLTATAVKDNDATCEGNDGGITVTANGGVAPYSYSIDNGVTYQTAASFTNAVNTTYNGTIKVKDANNCIATANALTIGQVNNLTLDILAAADTTICQDQSVRFTPVTNAGATATYLWTSLAPAVPNSTIDSIRILNATVTPADTVIYRLTVTYKACTVSDNVKVNVIWKPKVDAGPSVSICRLDSTLLTGSISHVSGAIDSLAWTPLDSLTTPTNSLTTWAHPVNSTWYRLTAYTKASTYGCDFAVYDSVKVVVPADVVASAGRDTIAVLGQPHQLMGSGGVGYSWWSPSGAVIQNPFTQNPTVILNSDANFFVEVQNSIGCKDTARVFVTVYDGPTYYVPNAFSPNGDGMNDIFRAIPSGIANTQYFKVFNRFGQTVFESNQYLKGWDGTFKGQKQPIGAYTWMIKGVDKNNKIVEMQGTVLIIQ